jgi:hypothetical protein
MPAPESDQEIVTDPEPHSEPWPAPESAEFVPICRMRTHEFSRVCLCLHACCAHDTEGRCRGCSCRNFTEAPPAEPTPPPPPPCSTCRYGRIRTDCPICRGTGVMGGVT